VIFVVLFDEFDHGQTLGDINVSLTLDGLYEEAPASEIAHQSKTLDSNLPTALYFTVSGVFSRSCVHKPFIPVKVLCENVKYFHHNHFFVTKIFATKKPSVGVYTSWLGVYLRILTRLLWTFFFSKFEEL
jgi:hypothetical protein